MRKRFAFVAGNDGSGDSARHDKTLILTRAGRGDRDAAVGIFVQLVAQRADRDAEDVGSVGPIAEAMLERLQDQVAFDIGDGAADQGARHLLGGKGGVGHGWRGLGEVEPVAVRRQDGFGSDLVALRHQHRTVDGVFQLADVALPAVRGQHPACVGGNRPQRHAVGVGIFLGKMLCQFEDVGRTVAQRRDLQVDDVETKQQVLAECAFAHGVGEVAVRGGDDADIDRHRLGAADAVDDALLDRAQQFGLQADVHLGDFVEQQRAAGRFLELADAAGDRAGEGALLVAEQFGLQQMFGDRRAINRNERPLGAGRARVDVARQHFLAGTGLAGDHDGGIRARDLLRQLDDLAHGFVAIDQIARIIGDRGEYRGDQFRIGRQRDVFLGASVDRGDRGAGVVGDAAGHDRHVDVLGFEPHHQVADVEGDVDQQQVGALAAAQHGHRLFDRLGVGHRCPVFHRDLGRGRELALQCANDEKPHFLSPVRLFAPFAARVSAKLLAAFRLDDFRHGHAELVFHQHDLATRHQAVVDVDVDGFADAAVEFEHGAGAELQQLADIHLGAAEHGRDLHRHVEHGLEVGRDARSLFVLVVGEIVDRRRVRGVEVG